MKNDRFCQTFDIFMFSCAAGQQHSVSRLIAAGSIPSNLCQIDIWRRQVLVSD